MEVPEVVALCFSSFLLGMLTNLGLYLLIVERPCRRKRKKATTFKDCRSCKHNSKGSKDEPCHSCENVNGAPNKREAQP